MAALLFLSFISSSTAIAAPSEQSGPYRKFVIYYGWYADGEGRLGQDINRIIRSNPEYVVSPYYASSGQVNLTPKVIEKFREGGVALLAYVATASASRDIDSVLAEIKTPLEAGVGGVMLDEVATLRSDWELQYYKKIYDFVKSYGSEKVVVANPGSILVSESVMTVSDIVCFEHQWKMALALDWFSKYPPTRYMGISSNDIAGVMGYSVGSDTAIRDTVEAWQSGIAYHYSTESYTHLPAWFEEYQKGINDFSASGATLGQAIVNTTDSAGKEIKGLWIEVQKDSRTVATGFSPASFRLPEGVYQVHASNYQHFVFSNWQDKNTKPFHDLTVGTDGTASLTAVYADEKRKLVVESVDSRGKPIKGMELVVSQDGAVVVLGETPINVKLQVGNYEVQAQSSKYYEFEDWGDGSKSISTRIDLADDSRVVAHFKAKSESLEELACRTSSNNEIAKSIVNDGLLGGIFELHMNNTVPRSDC